MSYSAGTHPGCPTAVGRERDDLDEEWTPDLDAEDLAELQAAEQDSTQFISKLPRESNRMGYYSTVCLIFNRMIGVGIFNSPGVVFSNTQSVGLSLILWAIGAIMALAGVVVYNELGLTIPRWPFGPDMKISTPRSGEALNYLNYMLKSPLFFATCMFGITFTILENTAGSSVSFAGSVLDAAHVTQTPGRLIGIALGANTFCCLLHSFSRKWGIIINNAFGTVKLGLLIFIVIIGFVWLNLNRDTARTNFAIENSMNFDNSPKLPYRYAEAMIFIILPYGAFHQINYVISELREPRKTLPRASFSGVSIVVLIYMALNIFYAAIVPMKDLLNPKTDVGKRFFQLTIGHVLTNDRHLVTFYSTIKAFSAFGNLIVVTFTTARVKQEIAKEGIFPYSIVFAQSYDGSALFNRIIRRKPVQKSTIDAVYSDDTPVATLVLHWIITTILVIAPILALQPKPYSSGPAYAYLTIAFVYNIDLTCFVFISLGLLCLRFTPSVRWAQKSEFKHPWMSITAAFIVLIVCAFPLIFIWVPDPAFPKATHTSDLVSWFAGQTFALCLLALAAFYWIVFRAYIKIRSGREGTTLHIKRKPMFRQDSGGVWTQICEIVTMEWKREIGLRLEDIEESKDGFGSSTMGESVADSGARRRQRFGGSEGRESSFREEVYEVGQEYGIKRKPVVTELPT